MGCHGYDAVFGLQLYIGGYSFREHRTYMEFFVLTTYLRIIAGVELAKQRGE